MVSAIVARLFAYIIAHVAADLSISPLTSYIGTTLQGCRKQCAKRPSCRSVLYNRKATYCKLFDVIFSDKGSVFIRKSGVVYRDSQNWPELNQPRDCHGTPCTSGEVCEGSCIVLECPTPPLIPGGYVSGNRQQIGSKLRYRCLDMNTNETFTECQINGKWTAVDMYCDTPRFELYGLNTYMHVDMSNILYGTLMGSFVLTSVSLETCLSRCYSSSDFCVGVNFNSENGTCISTCIRPGLNTQNTPTSLQGWIFYFKKMPIFYSDENYKEIYQFNFVQAKDHCKSLNTTLASKKDVQPMISVIAYAPVFGLLKEFLLYPCTMSIQFVFVILIVAFLSVAAKRLTPCAKISGFISYDPIDGTHQSTLLCFIRKCLRNNPLPFLEYLPQ